VAVPTGICSCAQTKNLLCFDPDSHDVFAQHAPLHDEGMNVMPILHRTLVWSDSRGETTFPAELHLLTLDLGSDAKSLLGSPPLSVLADGEDSHLGFVFSVLSSPPCVERTQAAGIRSSGHRRTSAHYMNVDLIRSVS
jgi:hypothetical protein